MEDEHRGPRPDTRIWRVIAVLFVAFIGLPLAAELYIDGRWFASVGYGEVWRTRLLAEAGTGVAAALFTALVLLVNVRIAMRASTHVPSLFLHDADGLPRLDLGRVAAWLANPLCAVAAVLVGFAATDAWSTWLAFAHASAFGVRDPIFDHDVGFYVFRLPLYDAAATFGLWLIAGVLLATAVIYVLRGAIVAGQGYSRVAPAARTHLLALLALLFVLLALRAYLDMFDVLYSTLGPALGASYADVHARLPTQRIQVGVAAIGALLALASIRRADYNLVFGALALYAASVVAVAFYPGLVHSLSVKPNELERESPYLKYNIEATRAAYGFDAVIERDLSASYTLSAADIERNHDTIDNIRLWDHQPLLDTFAQIQEIRTYYDFTAVDNDRYVIGGKLRQTMLSARELNSDTLPNPTWINKRFTFTHGYGLTLGPVNETSPEGLPVLFVQDIPPRSNAPELRVTRPAIYFGELSSDHVFVRTRNREFDYPSGEGYVQNDYSGKDGIRFDSTLMRLLLAVRLGSFELLLSNDIDSNSRVLLHRNVRERVQRVAPYLAFDADPYMVVRADGTLVWICDGYTATDRYPNSQRLRGGINYIRNSVKAVVDAYDGTIELYVADPRDPLLRTWRSAFGRSFAPLSAMPADIRAHLRYPERIFDIQTQLFSTYHMREPELLYNREDQWEIPTLSGGSEARMQPYYTVMKLPGESNAEFIEMLPFTPKRKDNLAAWMVARSDGAHLGQLIAYRFPKDRLVFGPQQIVNRINQDADISRQISLWDQRGSKAEFGTLLVIPIEESLIYVRPLYLRSEGGKIPELKRVIVVHEKQIAMKPTLREAIDAIFSTAPPSTTPSVTPARAAAEPSTAKQPTAETTPAADARDHFERAIDAQREGDWARYGEELQAVERLLREMAPRPADSARAPATPHAD
jgi:uncharacterized membrane protein (UPF0182 family)